MKRLDKTDAASDALASARHTLARAGIDLPFVCDGIEALARQRDALRARLDEAIGALEPFARYADAVDSATAPGVPSILDRGHGALIAFESDSPIGSRTVSATIGRADIRQAQAVHRCCLLHIDGDAPADAAPTARDEELHAALIRASLWHLIGRAPGEDLARDWRMIRNATLLELAQAAARVAAVQTRERVAEDGSVVLTVRTVVADRLVAACYVAASYEEDEDNRPVVVIPDSETPTRARAVMVVSASITADDTSVDESEA